MVNNKVLCIMPSLGGGGAEKMFVHIVNWLYESFPNLNIKVVLINDFGINAKRLNSKILIDCLHSENLKKSPVKLFNYIRNENPFLVFSNMTQLNIILALFKPILRYKLIVRETNIPSIEFKTLGYPLVLIEFYSFLYRYIDYSIFQSKDMANDFNKYLSYQQNKSSVINNCIFPISESLFKGTKKKEEGKFKVICVGRLSVQKGFHLLIDAIKINNCIDVQFDIYGEGPMRGELESKIKNYKLSNVSLMGFTSDLESKWESYDLCIVSSLHEGFPNFVLESFQHGVPVWSVNCKGGINELIDDSCGQVFNTVDLLIQELVNKSSVHFDRNEIIKRVNSKFSSEKISSEYLKVFSKVISK